MTEVSRNHLLFRMELKSLSASSIRFYYEGETEREREEKTGCERTGILLLYTGHREGGIKNLRFSIIACIILQENLI